MWCRLFYVGVELWGGGGGGSGEFQISQCLSLAFSVYNKSYHIDLNHIGLLT
jgi:hypothetical protein